MRASPLPRNLRPLFWEYDFKELTWKNDRDLIISRILASGGWKHILWLRTKTDDRRLKTWIMKRQGRGLSNRQIRFWELLLDLPGASVNRWLKAPGRKIWEGRCQS